MATTEQEIEIKKLRNKVHKLETKKTTLTAFNTNQKTTIDKQVKVLDEYRETIKKQNNALNSMNHTAVALSNFIVSKGLNDEFVEYLKSR